MKLQLIDQNRNTSHLFGVFFIVVLLILSACSPATPAVPPAAIITAPDPATALAAGKPTQISGKVSGSNVKSVDVFVNGNKYATVNQTITPNEFQVSVPWTPEQGGVQIVQIKGLNDKGEQVVQTSVIVNAQASAPAANAPAPAPAATTAAPASIAQPTTAAAATSAAAPTVAPTSAPEKPKTNEVVITNEFANVRSGPGTNYDRVGKLDQNAKANVTGKNTDATWWQIEFKDAPNNQGWVVAELVKFNGDAASVKVPAIPTPPPAPTAAPTRPPTILPTAPPAAAAPLPPAPPPPALSLPPSALLPYSQNMAFAPRNDIGDVPLGYNEPKNSTLVWEVNGAKSLELEITSFDGPGIFSDCKAGDLGKIQPATANNRRMPLQIPSGQFAFSMEDAKGYYLFTIHVVKSDGSTTTIPRNVIVGCYKK